MRLRKVHLFFIFLIFICGVNANAQKVGIKTNLISDATLSPNLGLEFRMSSKWTFDISGQMNVWNINEHRWRHWMVQPEARIWLCESFQGSFFGLHAIGGQFNIGNIDTHLSFLGSDFSNLRNHRYQGWGVGAAIAWGYAWMLGTHWNLEFEIGAGWIYTRFDRYPCTTCGTVEVKNRRHDYFGPTKLSLAFEYLF